MKTRLISAAVGLVLLIIILYYYDTIVFNVAMAFLASVATYELYHATGMLQNNKINIFLSILFAISINFSDHLSKEIILIISSIYFIIEIVIYLFKASKINILNALLSLILSMSVSLVFSILVFNRMNLGITKSFIMLFFILGSAWLSDSGAYFSGSIFGKHKLCPQISPKKTIEGLIGGIIIAIILNALLMKLLFSLSNYSFLFLQPISNLNLTCVIINTIIASLISVIGDLSFSVIKRSYGIKDYGNIMPGHGGVLDRFDSVLFVIPITTLLINIFPMF